MKVKIISDGTALGTVVVADNGEKVDGIRSVKWHVDVETQLATAVLEFTGVHVDVVGEVAK